MFGQMQHERRKRWFGTHREYRMGQVDQADRNAYRAQNKQLGVGSCVDDRAKRVSFKHDAMLNWIIEGSAVLNPTG